VGGANIQIVHYFGHGCLEVEKSMIHNFTVTFGTKYLTGMVTSVLIRLQGEFAVVPTNKICGRSLSSKIPVEMNSIFMKLYVDRSHGRI
jgi:hypothetical protein